MGEMGGVGGTREELEVEDVRTDTVSEFFGGSTGDVDVT